MKENYTQKRKTKTKLKLSSKTGQKWKWKQDWKPRRVKKIKVRDIDTIDTTNQIWVKIERNKGKSKSVQKKIPERESSDLTDLEIESDTGKNRANNENITIRWN